jgi:hypothetical protein
VINFGKVESRFERSVYRRPIAPIVIPVGPWHCESGHVSTHSKLRTSALSKFVTLLSSRFVSNKGRTQTDVNAAAKAAQKNLKKIKKKLATALAAHLKPDAQGQMGAFKRSKKFEKKACQASKSLINAPKPNQTNGETND